MQVGTAQREHDEVELKIRAALTDEVRELVFAAAVSDVDSAELAAIADEVAVLRRRLEKLTTERTVRSGFESALEAEVAGEPYRLATYNGFGIPLVIELGEGKAVAEFTADARHEGPPNSVHGGVSAWLMDSMLGLLMQARGRRGVTATLDTRYLARTPLDVPLHLAAEVTRVEARKVWIEGWIEAEGIRTVEAVGLFIELADQT